MDAKLESYCPSEGASCWVSFLPEEIAVVTGPFKIKAVTINSVNQDPVWLDVAIMGSGPLAAQRMIVMSRLQWISCRYSEHLTSCECKGG